MGILNVTPDSFFSNSRTSKRDEIFQHVSRMIDEGVDIIDIGGCSTRPGFNAPSVEEEMRRVDLGCQVVREISREIPISVDTFRAAVAKVAIEKWNIDIINDISGGSDSEMFETVAKNRAIYVLTHNSPKDGEIDVTTRVIVDLAKKINELHRLGVNDVIIDPGFGFEKSLEENYLLFDELEELAKMGYPILVGVSRKSMIYKTLGYGPENALVGSVALNMLALEKGTNILRVHDVKEAKEIVKIYMKLKNPFEKSDLYKNEGF